jgi:hypothetical protein
MKTFAFVILTPLALGGLLHWAFPDEQPQPVSQYTAAQHDVAMDYPPVSTPPVQVDQFDPAYGQLVAVELRVNWGAEGEVEFDGFTAWGDGQAELVLDATFQFRPIEYVYHAADLHEQAWAFSAPGADEQQATMEIPATERSIWLTDDLSYYVGTGTFTVDVGGQSVRINRRAPGGGTTTEIDKSGWMQWRIVYHYYAVGTRLERQR